MKENKKSIWRSKKMMFGVGCCAVLLAVVIFGGEIKAKYTLYKDWRSFQNYQRYIKEEPYSWREYMEYLRRKEEAEERDLQRLRDHEKLYYDDARNSLGGDTPEEAYDMLRQALRDNDLERALSLSFMDYREGAREALQPYADKGELSTLIKKWDLDDIDCSGDVEDVCEKIDEYHYCIDHGELICSAPDSPIDGVMAEHNVRFVKNVLNKWQLRGY